MSEPSSRVIAEPQWPNGGFTTTRQLNNHPYDVNEFGETVPNNPSSSWEAGTIRRQFQPPFRPPMIGLVAYDPTDPTTWNKEMYGWRPN